MILYFSGCGNSQYIAEELARLTHDEMQPILDLDVDRPVTLHDGVLGVVCPIYAWAVPRVVEEKLQKITFATKPEYCYLACTCGDSLGRAPERWNHSLRRMGLHLDAAFGFVMPETYINLKGFRLDSPDSEARKLAVVKERLPLVAEQIKARRRVIDVRRGPVPRLTTYLVNPIFYQWIITDKKFHASDCCIGCGKCAQVCPLHNIALVDGRPQWNGHCTNCMACYHHCPTNAIHFGKATQGKGQYYFGHNQVE